MDYKSFPPGWAHLQIPTSSRRAAQIGITLYAACRRKALWSQRLAWTLVGAFGPRILPGRSAPWTPPLEPELWSALLDRWRSELGRFDALVIYQRLQVQRSGLALLLIGGDKPLAFLKLHPRACPGLETETFALTRLGAFPPRSFCAPAPLGAGLLADWSYIAMTPLPTGLHRPPLRPPLREIAEEIQAALGALPRPAKTPPHWRPMHGDLTPWNLRRLPDRSLALIDWEDASWAPPGADEVLYLASAAALGSAARSGPVDEEPIAFWDAKIRARSRAQPRDASLAERLLEALACMRANSGRP